MRDDGGETALRTAKQFHKEKCVEVLRVAGASNAVRGN